MDSMNDGAEEIFGIEPAEIGGFLDLVFEQLRGRVPAGTSLEFLLFVQFHGKMRFTVPMPDAATEQQPGCGLVHAKGVSDENMEW